MQKSFRLKRLLKYLLWSQVRPLLWENIVKYWSYVLLISHSKNINVDFDAHHLTFDLVWVNFLS